MTEPVLAHYAVAPANPPSRIVGGVSAALGMALWNAFSDIRSVK
jgi:hypothetical protein